MALTPASFGGALPVDGYGPGFFRIGGEVRHGPVLLRAATVSGWGGYDDLVALLALRGEIDVLILGTGPQIAHAPGPLRAALEAAGIGVEVMDSPAACRTYNVLLSEGRRIAAALIPVA